MSSASINISLSLNSGFSSSESSIVSLDIPVLQVKNGKVIIPHNLTLEEGKEMRIRLIDININRPRDGTFFIKRAVGDSQEYNVWDGSRELKLEYEIETQVRTRFDECVLSYLHSEFPDLRLFDLEKQINLLRPRTTAESGSNGRGRNDRKVVPAPALQRMLHFYGKYMVIKGDFQSCKSKAMISLAIAFWLKKKSSMIILRNYNSDLNQLTSRFETEISKVKKFVESSGHSPAKLEIKLYKKEIPKVDLDDVLTGRKHRIMIMIGHEGNIRNYITQYLPDSTSRRKNFVLFIDECDLMDKAVESQKSPTKLSIELEKLKANAFCSFGVSATVLDKCMEESVKRGEMFLLSRPEYYQGIPKFTFCPITSLGVEVKPQDIDDEQANEDEKYISFTSRTDGDILENDKGMKDWLNWIAVQEPEYASFWKEYHPITALIRVGDAVEPMVNLGKYISRSHGKEIATIVYVGDQDRKASNGGKIKGGIRLYSANIPDTPITLRDGTRSIVESSGWHVFKNTGINFVYKYLRSLGVNTIPRIITIAGDLAGRGISFTSGKCDTPDSEDGKMNWHQLHMRLAIPPSRSSACPNILQAAARLCCVANDNLPIRLWCTKNSYDCIRKAYFSQEELISRMINIQEERYRLDSTDVCDSKELLPTIPMDRSKIPKGHNITDHAKLKIKRVANGNDGGWDMKEYLPEWEQDEKESKYEESKSDVDSGIYLINPRSLGEKSLRYYRDVVKAFDDEKSGIGLGIWATRSIIWDHIPTNKRTEIESSTWQWLRRYGSNVSDDTVKGLLMKKEDGRLKMRYNA